MSFRNFVEQLEGEGMLTRIKKEVSTEYDIAGIMAAMNEKPVFFEKVKENKSTDQSNCHGYVARLYQRNHEVLSVRCHCV